MTRHQSITIAGLLAVIAVGCNLFQRTGPKNSGAGRVDAGDGGTRDGAARDFGRDQAGLDTGPCGGCESGEYCVEGACTFPSRCRDLLGAMPPVASGPVILRNSGGETFESYCEMEREGGGWTRVGYIMPAETDQCPEGFRLIATPFLGCGKPEDELIAAMEHAPPHSFTEVMGTAIGRAFGTPDQFVGLQGAEAERDGDLTEPYVDGVGITLHDGDETYHVWSYAASFSDRGSSGAVCPCLGGSAPPDVFGSHYACDAGTNENPNDSDYRWFTEDPLWDGGDDPSDCDSEPGFLREISGTADVVLRTRLMTDQFNDDEDVALTRYELYIR